MGRRRRAVKFPFFASRRSHRRRRKREFPSVVARGRFQRRLYLMYTSLESGFGNFFELPWCSKDEGYDVGSDINHPPKKRNDFNASPTFLFLSPCSKRDIPLANYRTHTAHCRRSAAKCADCGESVAPGDVERHRQEAHALKVCDQCHVSVEAIKMHDHRVKKLTFSATAISLKNIFSRPSSARSSCWCASSASVTCPPARCPATRERAGTL